MAHLEQEVLQRRVGLESAAQRECAVGAVLAEPHPVEAEHAVVREVERVERRVGLVRVRVRARVRARARVRVRVPVRV